MDGEILSQLKDIHEAPAPSWWPPALGVWVLIAIIVVVMMIVWWLVRYFRGRIKRTLLAELREIEHVFVTQNDRALLQSSLSSLFRRAVFFKNPHVSRSMSLTDMVPLLAQIFPHRDQIAHLVEQIEQNRYQMHPTIDGHALLALAKKEMKRCRI